MPKISSGMTSSNAQYTYLLNSSREVDMSSIRISSRPADRHRDVGVHTQQCFWSWWPQTCVHSPLWTELCRTGRYTDSHCSSSPRPDPSGAASAHLRSSALKVKTEVRLVTHTTGPPHFWPDKYKLLVKTRPNLCWFLILQSSPKSVRKQNPGVMRVWWR